MIPAVKIWAHVVRLLPVHLVKSELTTHLKGWMPPTMHEMEWYGVLEGAHLAPGTKNWVISKILHLLWGITSEENVKKASK